MGKKARDKHTLITILGIISIVVIFVAGLAFLSLSLGRNAGQPVRLPNSIEIIPSTDPGIGGSTDPNDQTNPIDPVGPGDVVIGSSSGVWGYRSDKVSIFKIGNIITIVGNPDKYIGGPPTAKIGGNLIIDPGHPENNVYCWIDGKDMFENCGSGSVVVSEDDDIIHIGPVDYDLNKGGFLINEDLTVSCSVNLEGAMVCFRYEH